MTDTVSSQPADAAEAALFSRVRDGDRRARNELVERYMGLATHISRRYSQRTNADDMRQAAMIGLIKAVDRFDASLGYSFSSFAGATIEGELKRHVRDHSWVVKVPRSAKELHLAIRRGTEELTQRLGRSPSVDELATHLHLDRDDVLRGVSASAAYDVGSIDAPVVGTDTARSGTLSEEEAGFDATLQRGLVESLLERLPERERRIVEMRFFDEMSQSDIADAMGMSQMHVSRLLRKSFEQLRGHAADDIDDP